MPAQLNRTSVREFFAYVPERVGPPGWLRPIRIVRDVATFVIFVALWALMGASFWLALLGAALAHLGISVLLHLSSKASVTLGQAKRRNEYAELARATREIQTADFERAFQRIFKRSMLEPQYLKTFRSGFTPEKEADFFATNELQSKFGELFDKSIRIMSHGEKNIEKYPGDGFQHQQVFWEGGGRPSNFVNPTRSVSLFLTDTELVICDIEYDSVDQDLKEDVLRIQARDVVSVSFRAERKRTPLDTDKVFQYALRQNLTDAEYRAFKRRRSGKGTEADEFYREDRDVYLVISRTDSVALLYPLREISSVKLGVETVDRFAEHSEQDEVIDRTVNELNKVIRFAWTNPGAEIAEPASLAIDNDGGATVDREIAPDRRVPFISKRHDFERSIWRDTLLSLSLIAVSMVAGIGTRALQSISFPQMEAGRDVQSPADEFIVSPPPAPTETLVARDTGSNFRARPFAHSGVAIVRESYAGEVLNITGLVNQPDGAWYQVRLPNGATAYLKASLAMPEREFLAQGVPPDAEISPPEVPGRVTSGAVPDRESVVARDPAAAPAPVSPLITSPRWLRRPSGRDFGAQYPRNAMAHNIDARVVLECRVELGGQLTCVVTSEDPPGWGFGEASLRIAQAFQMAPVLDDGSPTEGRQVRIPIRWRVTPE